MNTGLMLIVLSAILWGTSGIAAKYLISIYSLSPLTIGAMRLLTAALVLLTVSGLQLKGKVQIAKRHYIIFLTYGVAIAAYQITYFTAVKSSMVSIATLVALCTAPLFVALLSRFFFREKISKMVMISLVASIVGTSMIIDIKSNQLLANSNYWGYILALAAGFFYGVYTLCGKDLVLYYPTTKVMSITVSLGALFMLPFLSLPGDLPWKAWALLLYLGVVPTAIAYIFFTTGLKKASPTKASIATLFEPLTSTTLSVLLLGERFNLSQVFGATLLTLALLLLVFNDYFETLLRRYKIRCRT